MLRNLPFNECLKILLKTLNISNKQLSKALNIDPSLISKWITNKRVPPINSTYVRNISEYIAYNISTTAEKKRIMNLIYKRNDSNVDIVSLIDDLEHMLIESQMQSLGEINAAYTHREKEIDKPPTNILNCFVNNSSKNQARDMFLNNTLGNNYLNSNQIITDSNILICTVLEMLKKALKITDIPTEPILCTINSDFISVDDINEFKTSLINSFLSLVKKGWNVLLLVLIDEDIERTVTLLDFIRPFFMTPNFNIQYYKNPFNFIQEREILIIPNVGALNCLSTKVDGWIDSGFYYVHSEAVHIFKNNFYLMTNKTLPLFKSFESNETIPFQDVILESEETKGNRFLLKDGLSSLTIPLNIYENYLKTSGEALNEVYRRINYHKSRITAFNSQIKDYKYFDICSIQAIERLIYKGEYSKDEYYMLENNVPTLDFIKAHLINVISLLKKHKNYQLALIDEGEKNLINGMFCLTKGKKAAIIETWNLEANDNESTSDKINLSITETKIVRGLEENFINIWNSIPQSSRDKSEIIGYLEKIADKL